jgi:hypothetical protein
MRALGLALAIITVLPAVAADGGKVESIGAFSDAAASEAVRNVLEPKGYRVTLSDGTVWCEIWLRKSLTTRAKADISGAIYTEIPDSAMIGVLSFPNKSADYRGQQVKPGAYTLRYSVHPTDGNHMGISAYRDFLLLVPVGMDPDPDAQIKFADLAKMSAKSIGANHAAPLSMVPIEGKGTSPSMTEDDRGYPVFNAKLKTASGADLPIAFVLKGIAEQ